MKLILFALTCLFSTSVFAKANCYDLSEDGKTWEAEPFRLCVERNDSEESEFILTLSKAEKKVAVYYLNSLPGAADANVYGYSAYSGSIIDDSIIVSIGYGEVHIGGGTYFYKEN